MLHNVVFTVPRVRFTGRHDVRCGLCRPVAEGRVKEGGCTAPWREERTGSELGDGSACEALIDNIRRASSAVATAASDTTKDKPKKPQERKEARRL